MSQSRDQAVGLLSAFGCFLLWGFLPLYFHLIGPTVSAWEILIHRVLWAAVLLALFVLLSRRARRVRDALCTPRLLLALIATATLIGCNWGTFIWAVTSNHVLQTSLGYYINPLLNVLLGCLFLRERLRPLQWLAVAIATVGVLIMVIGYGEVPWVSLALAGCFALYGLIRKQLTVDSITGLFIETLLLLPFALSWLGWLYAHHEAVFLTTRGSIDLLLFGCGVVTIFPLVFFAMGARRLKLGTIGLIQYMTPTLHLLTGVFLFEEPFRQSDLITFACIWLGLALYTTDTLRGQRQDRGGAAAPGSHAPRADTEGEGQA
ncbi:chloramphenicol-sensitive protein RarD [Kushneria sinocarnis]|uniref:Chloramphenicol-sensitive protein RarD n=1 Tax=Kushneria sinocarnis TaxID=595502 RepID=A0A420WWP4_9GAMM|nr:EamA family transporter RarD [Kushneria sinocarnis]RKR03529.1 chloramphenicol-sensitive protein RarD [Kushneria sinocarnis]